MISSCTIKLLWPHCPHISAQLEVFQLEKSHLVFLDASAPFESYVIIFYISFMSVLTWYGFYDGQHEVAHEGETGKVSRANFRDRDGRTVLIMRPGKQVIFSLLPKELILCNFVMLSFHFPLVCCRIPHLQRVISAI